MEESQRLLEQDIQSNPFNGVEDNKVEDNKSIPNWSQINNHYEQRWLQEKEKFQNQLKGNFFDLVGRFASGKQEIFQLCAPDRRVKLYTRAFLEMFESDYAPHVGEVERLAGKKVRKLYVTLPHNYHD